MTKEVGNTDPKVLSTEPTRSLALAGAGGSGSDGGSGDGQPPFLPMYAGYQFLQQCVQSRYTLFKTHDEVIEELVRLMRRMRRNSITLERFHAILAKEVYPTSQEARIFGKFFGENPACFLEGIADDAVNSDGTLRPLKPGRPSTIGNVTQIYQRSRPSSFPKPPRPR
jgi:hypothetical protein